MEQQVFKLKADFTELKRDGNALNPLYSSSMVDNPLAFIRMASALEPLMLSLCLMKRLSAGPDFLPGTLQALLSATLTMGLCVLANEPAD